MSETVLPVGDLTFVHAVINSVWVCAGGVYCSV